MGDLATTEPLDRGPERGIGDHPGIGPGTRFAVLTGGLLADLHGKLAHGVLRFRGDAVVAVVDELHAGKTADQVVPGVTRRVPIVGTLREALASQPTALLLGTTPAGGQMPPEWRSTILEAIDSGLSIVAGMHTFLGDDHEIAARAQARGVAVVDLRRPPDELELASGRVLDLVGKRVVLTVGSDAAIGKMSTALAVDRSLTGLGVRSAFVATGQTGIAIAGWGVAVDRVIGDFMPGVAEALVLRAAAQADWVIVEGQGSIAHPAYSPVALALLHGAAPTDLILCHDLRRTRVVNYERAKVPALDRLVRTYEDLSGYVRPARVRAIALNTSGSTPDEAAEQIALVSAALCLPTDDVVRGNGDGLATAILGVEP